MSAPTDSEKRYPYFITHATEGGRTVWGVVEESESSVLVRCVHSTLSIEKGTTKTLTKDEVEKGLGDTYDISEHFELE